MEKFITRQNKEHLNFFLHRGIVNMQYSDNTGEKYGFVNRWNKRCYRRNIAAVSGSDVKIRTFYLQATPEVNDKNNKNDDSSGKWKTDSHDYRYGDVVVTVAWTENSL